MFGRLRHSLSRKTSLSTASIDAVSEHSMPDVPADVHATGAERPQPCNETDQSSLSCPPSCSLSPQPSSRVSGDGCSADSLYQGSDTSSAWSFAEKAEGMQRFALLHELGRGSSGSVTLAVEIATGRQLAIKQIPVRPRFRAEAVLRELENQQLCRGHPNIIQLEEVFLADDHLCIVMELAADGDLATYMEQMSVLTVTGMPEDEARYIFQQVLVGIDYCHRLGIANRDIKLDNIMLHGMWPYPAVKLCDFGFSKAYDLQSACKTTCGTPEYICPEVLTNGKNNTYDGTIADAWSAGVVLYALLNGAFPFTRDDGGLNQVERLQQMFGRITRGDMAPFSVEVSAECRDLVVRLLDPNPLTRMSVREALCHMWVLDEMDHELQDLNDQVAREYQAEQRAWLAAPRQLQRSGIQTRAEIIEIVHRARQAGQS